MALYRFRPVTDSLIVVLVLVTVLRIASDRLDIFSTRAVPKLLEPGDRLSAEIHPRPTPQRNVILFALSTCAACQSSVSLYQRVGRMTAEDDPQTRFVVVSTEAESLVRDWLVENSIRFDEVIHVSSFGDMGVTITPTLAIASSSGLVSDVHIGTLKDANADTLFARLRAKHSAPPLNNTPRELSTDECDRLAARANVSRIDLREREEYSTGHAPGAINIPLHELPSRAMLEIPTEDTVLIDGAAPIDRRRVAGIALRNLDYPQVMLCGDLRRHR